MANKEDENWFADYQIGRMTGQGWGFYGEMGNLQHRQEQQDKQQAEATRQRQEEKRRQKEAERWQIEARRNKTPQVSPQAPTTYQGKTKPWSNLMATLGFLGGAGVMYAQPEPSMAAAIIVGLISAFIFGRFYKVFFAAAFILIVLWLLLGGIK